MTEGSVSNNSLDFVTGVAIKTGRIKYIYYIFIGIIYGGKNMMKKKVVGILIVTMLVILSSLSLNAMGLKSDRNIINSELVDDWPPIVSVLGIYNKSDVTEIEFNITYEFKIIAKIRGRSIYGIYKDIRIVGKNYQALRFYKFPFIHWDRFLLDRYDNEFVELKIDTFIGLFDHYTEPMEPLLFLNGYASGVEIIYR